MDIGTVKLAPDATNAALNIALKVELLEGKRFRVTKSVEELVALIKFSQTSQNPEIKKAIDSFCSLLSDEHKAFFNVLGLDLSLTKAKPQKGTYRGSNTQSEDKTEESRKGKRKIVYRGKEQWV